MCASSPLLTSFGWNERVPDFSACGLVPGPVAQIDRSTVIVAVDTGFIRAAPVVPEVTTCDWVGVSPSELWAILEVAPRWSLLQRAPADGFTSPQLLAANVDVTMVAVGLDRGLNLRRLDQMLTIAWSSASTPWCRSPRLTSQTTTDRCWLRPSWRSVVARLLSSSWPTSVLAGRGLERLRALVPAGVTAVLLGESGAGETDGLVAAFPDIAAQAAACHFRDCSHRAEPGCAVLLAVETGVLASDRLGSFHRLERERASAARRADPRRGRADARVEVRGFNPVQRTARPDPPDLKSVRASFVGLAAKRCPDGGRLRVRR